MYQNCVLHCKVPKQYQMNQDRKLQSPIDSSFDFALLLSISIIIFAMKNPSRGGDGAVLGDAFEVLKVDDLVLE